MNKYQEALNEIAYISLDEDGYCVKEIREEECAILQKLVDKATPKKPKVSKDAEKSCPICDKTIFNPFDDGTWVNARAIYCPFCGQRLEWSGEEPRDLEMEVYEELCVGCSDEKICHEECEHCVQFYERLKEKENE